MFRTPNSHSWPVRPQRAFTLVEIAVVVMILGLIIALTLPGYRKVTLKSKATTVVNDLRIFSAAFSNASLQNGGWPTSSTGPGNIPPEMTNALSVVFTQPTPIGGQYEWLKDTVYGKAVLRVTNVSTDQDLLEIVDEMMDDGNINSGNVQVVPGFDLIYIIEK